MPKEDLVFEIGTEEIPAAFVPRALSILEELLRKRLEAARLTYKGIKALGTPRRLTLIAEGLIERQPDTEIEVRGPQKKSAFDSGGKPTKTLEGFAAAHGLSVREVKTVKTEKGEYVSAVKKIKGEQTLEILPNILKGVISADLFPKSMRWGSYDVSFARPVHWILAVYAGKTVEFEFGHVKSSSHTFGHRFLSAANGPAKPLSVDGIRTYLEVLEANYVIAEPERRKNLIRKGLLDAASGVKGEVLPDEGLLEEVTHLVEYPVVVLGGFDREFLDLPRDVVINAMREHQRYFSVVDKKGVLLPYFMTIANTKAPSMDTIRKGNERVLRARLNDAKFYFERDIKTPLAARVEALKGVVFQSRLGTSYEKVRRFTELALYIGALVGFSRPLEEGEKPEDFLGQSFNPAAYDTFSLDSGLRSKYVLGRTAILCKADLVSGMVGEFPKLQGIMGSVYARRNNEAEEVSVAIYEHYLPAVSGGTLPASVQGAIVSIADKLDTIAGCFGVGLIPTGAQDPYALRRQALGILAIMLDKEFSSPLDEMVDKALRLLENKLTRDKNEARHDVLEFFRERLKNQLLAQGLSFDSIDAALSTPWSDIPDAVKRIKAIEEFKKHPACPSLAIAFKRVSNILRGYDLKGRTPDPMLFKDPEEGALFKVSSEIGPVIRGWCEKGEYQKALEALASIKDKIDTFFDKVLVMAEDERIRENRLVLVNTVRDLYYNIADLSKLTVAI